MRRVPAAFDYTRLKWVGPGDLARSRPSTEPSGQERQRCIQYLENCYGFSELLMTPETYVPCAYGCPALAFSESSDESVTDGVWWFAGSTIHHMRTHGLSLPESVVAELRKREFQVPDLDVA
jgi:hypothetical protein